MWVGMATVMYTIVHSQLYNANVLTWNMSLLECVDLGLPSPEDMGPWMSGHGLQQQNTKFYSWKWVLAKFGNLQKFTLYGIQKIHIIFGIDGTFRRWPYLSLILYMYKLYVGWIKLLILNTTCMLPKLSKNRNPSVLFVHFNANVHVQESL